MFITTRSTTCSVAAYLKNSAALMISSINVRKGSLRPWNLPTINSLTNLSLITNGKYSSSTSSLHCSHESPRPIHSPKKVNMLPFTRGNRLYPKAGEDRTQLSPLKKISKWLWDRQTLNTPHFSIVLTVWENHFPA
ncbi:hypothetical protein L798_09052 [Zootermopsis nevadensis]|uniref:Uncharacterized protein n=1 Tax=Zootermopsis nevadensis TaxID=136037 RepID=A0A067RE03_ZOONE|nr:hypothetical protein L798_09052 [Zootermopsis nevadensis]